MALLGRAVHAPGVLHRAHACRCTGLLERVDGLLLRECAVLSRRSSCVDPHMCVGLHLGECTYYLVHHPHLLECARCCELLASTALKRLRAAGVCLYPQQQQHSVDGCWTVCCCSGRPGRSLLFAAARALSTIWQWPCPCSPLLQGITPPWVLLLAGCQPDSLCERRLG